MAHVKIRTCRPISTLKSLCEKVAAEHLVEPRNAVQLLEIADSLGAEDLRKHCEIQAEQSKTKGIQSAKSKGQVEDASDSKSGVKIHISSFLPSNPIPVISAQTSQVSEGERSTPPWIASGTPPVHSQPSLRDIQMQQRGWLQLQGKLIEDN